MMSGLLVGTARLIKGISQTEDLMIATTQGVACAVVWPLLLPMLFTESYQMDLGIINVSWGA
jgi:hypothetical protein